MKYRRVNQLPVVAAAASHWFANQHCITQCLFYAQTNLHFLAVFFSALPRPLVALSTGPADEIVIPFGKVAGSFGRNHADRLFETGS